MNGISRLLSSFTKRLCRRSFSEDGIKRTCLHDFHVTHKGQMINFHGWTLPLQYADQGISASHLHTRNFASVFDVSHMLQLTLKGQDALDVFQKFIVADLHAMSNGQATLTLFTNAAGGIEDDLIVTKVTDSELYVVANAGCAEKDWQLIFNAATTAASNGLDVKANRLNKGLLALQGPSSSDILQKYTSYDLQQLGFMQSRTLDLNGIKCRLGRCGYTGEDGFEISVDENKALDIATLLIEEKLVKLAGLGARDSLRIEAGLCLYGNEMNETITPVEAGLSWTIAKSRRERRDFPGAETIMDQLNNKPAKRRVGLISTGPPAREGTVIFDEAGMTKIGMVTSGIPSPSLKKNVAIGYVKTVHAKVGTKVMLDVRNKQFKASVVKMPFLPSNYHIA